MTHVLLTGGGGAIGVHVIAHLMDNTDWRITVLDSFRHKGSKDRIAQICEGHAEWRYRMNVIQHDLVCPINRKMARMIGPVNHILHLAALSDVGLSIDNPVYVIKTNVDSTLTMLEYAAETDHDTFILFSTDEVYGPVAKGQAHPEWSPMRPSNAYSASKAASECIAYPYWRAGKVKLIITNTMNNFGPMQAPSKFPAMVQRQLEEGKIVTIHGNEREIGTRFYIHSRNAADAVLYILQHLPPYLHQEGEIDDPDRYHVVGNDCLSNLDMARHIARLMDLPLVYELVDFHRDNPAHDIHYGLEDNKLRVHGWKPPLTFEESMMETIRWQQEHKEWI